MPTVRDAKLTLQGEGFASSEVAEGRGMCRKTIVASWIRVSE
jgi:hypothetical protein